MHGYVNQGGVGDISRLTKLILRVTRNLKNMQMEAPDVSDLSSPLGPALHKQTLPDMWKSCGLTVDGVASELEIDAEEIMAWLRGDKSPRYLSWHYDITEEENVNPLVPWNRRPAARTAGGRIGEYLCDSESESHGFLDKKVRITHIQNHNREVRA